MQLTPLLGIGLVLIAIGVIVLMRDMRRFRRLDNIENGPGHDPIADHITLAEVEITYPDTPTQSDKFAHSESLQTDSPLHLLRNTIDRVSAELEEDTLPDGTKLANAEREWAVLTNRIETSVQSVNSVTKDVNVSIRSTGQPGWSFGNRGFGSFRRVMLGLESVAWLRLELTNDDRFICALRSHGDEKSALNANESIPAHALSVEKISALIATSMQPITKYAARNVSRQISDKDVDQTIWLESEELVRQALNRAGEALKESGVTLDVGLQPQWNEATKRHRLITRILLDNRLIAQLYIERPTPRNIECLVVPTLGAAGSQAERERVDFANLSATNFAEVIVNCAWPAIETAWNAAQTAKRANV